jgi:adenosine kinase
MDDNQLTGYYGGAMWRAGLLGLDDGPPDVDAVIIGPNDPGAMKRLVRECRDRRVPFVFDPAHQLPMMAGEDVTDSANGAWITIGNDYELELIQERTGRDMDGMLELTEIVVTTLGRHGSRITTRHGAVDIPAAPSDHEVDPTGCGDAYRAGLVAGLLRGLPLYEAGCIASLAATYAVEHVGTIEHSYTREEFAERHRLSFGADIAEEFWTG